VTIAQELGFEAGLPFRQTRERRQWRRPQPPPAAAAWRAGLAEKRRIMKRLAALSGLRDAVADHHTRNTLIVMAGLVPAIHAFLAA
jgi:hypothetical protein